MAASRPARGGGRGKDRGNHGNHHLRRNCCRLGYHRRWAAKELRKRDSTRSFSKQAAASFPSATTWEHVPVWGTQAPRMGHRAEREKTKPFSASCYYACDEYSHSFS